MKQLLHSCEGTIIVGLSDRGFVVRDSVVCELLAPETDAADDTKPQKSNNTVSKDSSKVQQKQAIPTPNGNEIQAVAIASFENNQVWCAVSRYNKTLSLYCIESGDSCLSCSSSSSSIAPKTIHKTVKRVLCLSFASIPSENPSTSPPLHVVICGDLIGDATAYPLAGDSIQSKVLLGHTASMLTGLNVTQHHLLTCDRDEKIRISCFPQTFVIEGYLLGHTAFITSMDATTTTDTCVSCSGDDTVRLWHYIECKELARFDTTHRLPTRVAISPNGMHVAVVYDGSNKLDVLTTNGGGTSLELLQTMECPTQPLSVKFVSDERMLVLMRQPDYLVEYKLEKRNQFSVHVASTTVQALKQVVVSSNITMPTTIMEIDPKTGQLKLQKEAESRGAKAEVLPWMKADRIQTAKEASKRRDKRRRMGKEEGKDGDKE